MKFNYLLKTCTIVSLCAVMYAGTGSVNANAETADAQIAIDAETFPDENFRAIAAEQADTNQDGMLSEDEVQKVTKITVRQPHPYPHSNWICDSVSPAGNHDFEGIPMDFTGIDTFPNLKNLVLHNVEPTGIPFERLGMLKSFSLSSAPAMELDFSKAQGLETIEIIHTDITELDLPANASLKKLYLRGCGLSQADFSSCKNLEELWLDYNAFQNVGLTKNSSLKTLHLEHNKLTALDLTKNNKLESLYIDFNNFTKINSRTLKVSASSRLSTIHAFTLKKCTLLDTSHIGSLQKLYAASGKFSKVIIGKNLQTLDISSGKDRQNPMTTLNAQTLQAPAGAKLKELECYQGNLKKIDLRHFKQLKKLSAEDNKLVQADLSGNLKLKSCDLSGNKLKKLIASKKSNSGQKKLYRQIAKKNGAKLLYK